MADAYSVSQSLSDQDSDMISQSRNFVWINDSNAGSYQSQIVFDLASISNSGRWFDAKQSYITIPLVLTLAAVVGNLNNASLENNFALSLKNSYANLVHSMQVEITNNAVVSTTAYSNLAMNFGLLTRMSPSDVENIAPSIGFGKDSSSGLEYVAAGASTLGLGEVNNVITPTLFNPTTGYGVTQWNQNKGRLDRMQSTSFDTLSNPQGTASLASSGKNYAQKDALAGAGKVVNYYTTATLPLAILHDLFDKLPLTRGAYFRITLNLTTNCTTTVKMGAQGYTSVVSSSQYNQVPYMISPCIRGQGFDPAGTTACTEAQISIGIGRNTINATGTTFQHAQPACKFYACMYDFTPSFETLYLSKNSTKTVKYQDYLSFQTLNVGAGATYNQILSNSVSRIRKIVGIPQIASTVNFAGTAGFIAPMNSPFTSAPSTTSTTPITNMNVLISGTNLYQANYTYDYEQFIQEVRKCNSINGGESLGLSSGLISQTDFENGYRFIVHDVSRTQSQATDDIGKSVQVIGTNAGSLAIDIWGLVFYEREITIDTGSGNLLG